VVREDGVVVNQYGYDVFAGRLLRLRLARLVGLRSAGPTSGCWFGEQIASGKTSFTGSDERC